MIYFDSIPSKSYAHRVMIADGIYRMNNKDFEIDIDYPSEDILATRGCIESIISGSKEIYCSESGATFRFLIPLVSAIGGRWILHTKGRLINRPISPLLREIGRNGVKSKIDSTDLILSGHLRSGDYFIEGGISSQFISGLLFALPILDGDSRIFIEGRLESRSYVDMTIDVIGRYGIEIEEIDSDNSILEDRYSSVFLVKGRQEYIRPDDIHIEGDWSNAGFLISCPKILKEGICLKNMYINSSQGDEEILEILKMFGVDIDYTSLQSLGDDECVLKSPYYKECEEPIALNIVSKTNRFPLKSVELDVSMIPDLVPVISILAAISDGVSTIKNIRRLRFKESDRVVSICSTLNDLGVDSWYDDDNLYIKGSSVHGGRVDSFNDHRIVMMAAMLSTISDGVVEISGWKAVRKSYPDFFEVMKERNLDYNIRLLD